MYVGSLGSIIFMTSTQVVNTFHDYSRESSGRWAKHEIIGEKPAMEFLKEMKIMIKKIPLHYAKLL